MSRRRFMIGKRKDIDLSKDLIDYYKFYYSTKDEITGITNSASISYSANAIIDMSGYFGSYSRLKFARSSVVYPEFTISVWIKLDGSYYDQYRGIFSSRSTNEYAQYGLVVEDTLLIVYGNSTRMYTEDLPSGKWTMITFVVSNNTGTIYINGIKREPFSYPAFPIQPVTYIGCDYLPVNTDQNNRGLRGYMDELAVWSRGISSSDVLNLYNNGKGLEIL